MSLMVITSCMYVETNYVFVIKFSFLADHSMEMTSIEDKPNERLTNT